MRALLIAAILASAAPAGADPVKVIVLQTEGRADADLRARLDTSLIKLASTGDAKVTPGDITFTDAAAAVGCTPDVPTCRDEVLGMLTVDEIVYAVATPKPGGVELVVHRVERGGTVRDAKTLLATGASTEQLDDIAPLFGGATPSAADPIGATSDPGGPPPDTLPVATDPTQRPTEAAVTMQPAMTDLDTKRGTRLQVAGMIGGGAMVFVGFLLWGEAGTIQEDVDTHPTSTREQLEDLAALERRGDSFAAWGNVLFLGGAVLGGISTYYYVKGRKARRAAQTARIAPAVFGDHGAGITFTFGGAR